MILTCPSCGTQYVVKDGAIPAAGRQVRCKACQHSWREFAAEASSAPAEEAVTPSPQPAAAVEEQSVQQHSQEFIEAPSDEEQFPEDIVASSSFEEDEPLAEAPSPPPIPPEAEVDTLAEAAPSHRLEWVEEDEDFSPFAPREPEPRKSRRILWVTILVLLIAATVAGVWFLAPPELRQRLGLADAGDTPLQLMMTHSDRTQLASGNEFLNISGRIINPTDQQQKVPPIYAQLHDGSGKVVYKWTIPPPMKTIPPGGSASFNSAELNIPPAAQELTVTLGEPKI